MKTRFLIVAGVLIAGAASGVGLWVASHDRPRVVRGSPTIEFVPSDKPKAGSRPAKLVRSRPWPTYGYDARRSHLAADFGLRPPFRRLWSLATGWFIEFPPSIAYGRVFVAQLRGRFYALDAKTGKVDWERRFRACTAASPTVGEGLVYQPFVPEPCNYADRRDPGFVIAFRVRDGRIRWRFPVASESSTLLVGNSVYFGAWDHRLYSLNARTGKRRWSFKADDELNSSPAYARGTIYIGSDGGSLYAIDARTGRLRWRARSFSSLRWGREYFYATPTVAYGRVYIGNSDGIVYAYGAQSGRLLWAQRAGTYVYSAAAVWRKTVYVGSYDGKLYALDAATGDVKWTHQSPSAIHGAPTVMAGLVYFSSCGTCGHNASREAKFGRRGTYAVDARTGRLVWSFPDGRYSPIVADSERVYLVGNTRVYGLDPCLPRRRRTLALGQRAC